MGWFPLGWGEPYVPSYHVSRNYFQQVNVTNTRITNITTVTNNYYVTNNNTTVVNNNIHNIRYANQNVSGAVTAVPTRAMTNSESVARVSVAVPANELRTASVANVAEVAPARTSVLGTRAGGPAALPPSRLAEARPVVSHVAPPARPVPFEARQEDLAKTPGRPLDAETESRLRSNLARPVTPTAQNPQQPMQPVRPGSPMMASPSGIQSRPVPRPGMPAANPAATDTHAATTPAQPSQQVAPAGRPGSATATNPEGIQPRPVPRPIRPMSPGNLGADEQKSVTNTTPSTPQPVPPVRTESPAAAQSRERSAPASSASSRPAAVFRKHGCVEAGICGSNECADQSAHASGTLRSAARRADVAGCPERACVYLTACAPNDRKHGSVSQHGKSAQRSTGNRSSGRFNGNSPPQRRDRAAQCASHAASGFHAARQSAFAGPEPRPHRGHSPTREQQPAK